MYKQLEKLLNKHKMTAYELSRKTGISTSTLTDWKMGRYTPKIDKIKKLAEFFGVDINYFLDDEEEICQ